MPEFEKLRIVIDELLGDSSRKGYRHKEFPHNTLSDMPEVFYQPSPQPLRLPPRPSGQELSVEELRDRTVKLLAEVFSDDRQFLQILKAARIEFSRPRELKRPLSERDYPAEVLELDRILINSDFLPVASPKGGYRQDQKETLVLLLAPIIAHEVEHLAQRQNLDNLLKRVGVQGGAFPPLPENEVQARAVGVDAFRRILQSRPGQERNAELISSAGEEFLPLLTRIRDHERSLTMLNYEQAIKSATLRNPRMIALSQIQNSEREVVRDDLLLNEENAVAAGDSSSGQGYRNAAALLSDRVEFDRFKAYYRERAVRYRILHDELRR